jgi:hypothetical protein
MEILTSNLTHHEQSIASTMHVLHEFNFILGGNWDYEHGYLDRSLDEENKVWLRIPFHVMSGEFDGNADHSQAIIRLGTPIVLHHRYNEELDTEAKIHVVGALVDQFQDPIEPDADVEQHWIEVANQLLDRIEQTWEKSQGTRIL